MKLPITFLCLLLAAYNSYATDNGYKGNVQTVMKLMKMYAADGSVTETKTIYKYDEGGNLTEEIWEFGNTATFLNFKTDYTYNSEGQLLNKTRYMQPTADNNGINLTLYTYDDNKKLVKEKNISSSTSDSTMYWYQTANNGNIIEYSSGNAGDTQVRVINAKKEPLEMIIKGMNLHYTYKYDNHDNLVEEQTMENNSGKLKKRATTLYNIDNMPVERNEYNMLGKLTSHTTNAYTNMDEQGNYLKNTCMHNEQLAYIITTEIVYRP